MSGGGTVAENTVDFQTERKRHAKKRLKKRLRIPAVIFALILIFTAVYFAAGEVRRSNFDDSFRAIPKTIRESRGFPYNEDELSLDKVTLIGDKPLIVSDSGVEVISQNADSLYQLRLDRSDTRVASYHGRAFVYSNTASKAYLISRTVQLASFDEGKPIVTGTVGKNGAVALSYSTGGAQSVVKVYSPRQKLVWEWECEKEYVSSVSLSSDNKKILISALGVDNAEIYSRVILFRTDKTEPQFDVTMKGTSILKVIYSKSGKLTAVGDNKTVILTSKGAVRQEMEYADDALYTVDSDDDGNILICYKEFGGSKLKVVKIPSMAFVFKEFEIDYMPESVDIKGDSIAFASGSAVEIYSSAGKLRKTYECDRDVKTVLISNTGIYTLENGSVCRY